MPGGLGADDANSLVIFALLLSVGWDYIRSSLYPYRELVDLYIDPIITEDVTCIQSIETTVVEGVSVLYKEFQRAYILTLITQY